MQNLLVINQPNRINAVKRFAQSRGLQRYSIIKDSGELMRSLLVETSNVYVFDYFLDMPLVNTLADMRDSVNTLMVFVPEARIGNIYLNLTDKIHVMPDEVALLQWMWDTQATSLQNVLACRAAGTPFCMVSMPDMNIRPDQIQVNVRPKQIKATYSMTSGAVVSSRVNQLQVGIRFKGKPILQDEYDVRNQVGIFSSANRVADMPECDLAGDDYVAQQVSSEPIKGGFSLPFSFSLPKPAPKPKKEKPVKEPKPKKEKPVRKPKNEPVQEHPIEETPFTLIPAEEATNAGMQVTAAPEWATSPKEIEKNTDWEAPQFSHEDGKSKENKLPWAIHTKKPKQEVAAEEPTGILDVHGSTTSDVNMEQVFGVVSAKDKEAAAKQEIDTSEADELLKQSKEAEEAQKVEAAAAKAAREEAERLEREKKEREKAEQQANAQPIAEPQPETTSTPAPAKKDRITIDLSAATTATDAAPQRDEQRSRMKRRFSNLKSSTYSSVEDYMVGNNMITAKQKMEIMSELSMLRQSGQSIRFYDLVLKHNLCEPEDMVQIIAKVNRMEILGWKQVENLTPIFDEFQLDHCKKLKFFRAPDDSHGNVRIVCSLSASSIDSSIRRLFDTPRILYTLDQYVVEKLNSIV